MPLRLFTTAELVLTQRRNLERPLLLLVLLGSAGFALAEGNVIYLALIVAGLAINAAALRRRSEVYVPRPVVNGAVLVATGVFLIEFLSGDEVLPALGHYLILIQLCKLFEQKRNRDYAQLIALSLVLMVAGSMITNELWFALLLAAYLPAACYVAMVLTLKVSLDRRASAHLPVESRPIDPHRVAWNVSTAFPRGSLRALAAQAAAACALAGVAVFLGTPRVRPSVLGQLPGPGLLAPRLTGFSTSIRLREVGRITPDRRIVMRVQVDGGGGGVSPAGFSGYLRSRVYETYRNGSWFVWRGRPVLWYAGPPPGDEPPQGHGVVVQQVTMVPELLPNLFATGPVCGIDPPGGMRLGSLYPELTTDTRLSTSPVRYTARSWSAPLTDAQKDWLGRIAGYRPLPADRRMADDDLPAVGELARTWCADLLQRRRQIGRDAREPQRQRDLLDLLVAERIEERLRSGYAYSLDMSAVDPDRDPVEDFLLRTRRGHCEFFASAMTLMCRAVGVNARLGTGYLVDERDSAGGYLVRQCEAHAWCEVYTPTTDWRIFDPSPPDGRRPASGALAGLRRLWDSVGFYWKTNVIGYGESHRRGLFGRVVRWFDSVGTAVATFCYETAMSLWQLIAHGRADYNLARTLMAAALAVAGGVLAVTARRLLRRARRARSPRIFRRRQVPAFFLRLLKLLRRRGLRQRPEQTVREFLLDAAGQLDLPLDAVSDLTGLLYRVRWGGAAASAAELTRADRTVAEIAAGIRTRPRRR